MDHLWVAGGATGEFPGLEEKPSLDGPNRPNGIYVIRFRNTKNGPRSKDFLRGYGFQGGQGTGFSFDAPGFGDDYKRAVKNPESARAARGLRRVPALLRELRRDRPLGPGRRLRHPDPEDPHGLGRQRAQDDPGHGRVGRRDDGGGGREEHRALRPHSTASPASASTSWASRAWASDPKTSVLNQFQQAHDVANLFVMDGAGFTSGACQNPTLTIMALAVRSTDYLLGEMKRGNL